MKKNKMNFDAAMKQFDLLLPDSYREPYKSALTACKDSNAGIKDACDAALAILKCFYEKNSMFTFAWRKCAWNRKYKVLIIEAKWKFYCKW